MKTILVNGYEYWVFNATFNDISFISKNFKGKKIAAPPLPPKVKGPFLHCWHTNVDVCQSKNNTFLYNRCLDRPKTSS